MEVFIYEGSPISFDFEDGNKMINATQMLKCFANKRISDFTNSKITKEYVKVLESKTGFTVLKVNHGGNNQGTWMHKLLAIRFAQWLSPHFAVWVDEKIEQLLTKGYTSVIKKSDDEKVLESMQILCSRVEAQSKQIAELAPKADYTDRVLTSKDTWTTTIIAKQLGMTAIQLNKKLKEMGVQFKQRKTWVLTAKYQSLGYTKITVHPYTDNNGVAHTQNQSEWTEKGRRFIHTLINGQLRIAV